MYRLYVPYTWKQMALCMYSVYTYVYVQFLLIITKLTSNLYILYITTLWISECLRLKIFITRKQEGQHS